MILPNPGASGVNTGNPVTVPISQLSGLPIVAQNLSALGGGTIRVSGPGTFHANATIALAAQGAIANVDIFFDTGALVVIDQGVAFVSSIGPDNYTKLFDWSNCSNVNVYNCTAIDNDTTSATKNKTACHVIGGNAQTLRFYDCYAKGFTKWMFFVNGYSNGVAGLGEQDGPVNDVIFVRPVSVNCGNTTTPDGGFMKIGNNTGTKAGSPYVAIANIGALEPEITGCNFAFVDITPSCPVTDQVGNVVNSNYWVEGGQGQMTANLSTNCRALWVENAANWTSAQLALKGIRFRNFLADMNQTTNGSGGIVVNNTANDVLVEACTVKGAIANGAPAFLLVGRTGAGLAPMHGRNYRFKNNIAINCAVGMQVDATAGAANTVLDGLDVDGLYLDDAGSGVMTTGLLVKCISTKLILNARFRNVDATRIAAAGNPFVYTAASANPMEPSIQFERCPGITPLGSGTWVVNAVHNVITPGTGGDGGAAAPTTAVVYYVACKNGATVSATASGTLRTALSITDARGFPLQAFTQMSKASGTANVPTAGKTYTVIGEDMTVTAPAGGGMSITVTDFAGNVLFNAVSSLAAAFIPQGSTVAVTVGVGAAWTVIGSVNGNITNPFIDSMAGVAIPAVWVEYGGTVSETFGAGTAATWTVSAPTQTGTALATPATIANPFSAYRALGDLGGGTVTFTTAKSYKVGFDIAMDFFASTETSLVVKDQYGNTIASPLVAANAHVIVRLKAGQIFLPTFVTEGAVTISDDSGG